MTDTEDESRSTKPVKEILVVRDTGVFKYETGDVYDGFFEAKKKDVKSFKMFGPGTYTTAENDTYVGIWENDKLVTNEKTTITYHDGHRYEGFIKDFCYSGQGKYIYPDECVLSCSFIENCPTGALTLTDPNGHTWTATASAGYAWFEPTNHYYEMLEKTRELPVKPKRGRTRRTSKMEIKSNEEIALPQPPSTPAAAKAKKKPK